MLSDDEFDDVDLRQLKKNYKDYYDGDRNEGGERDGFGSAQFSNGDKYEGEYKEGKRNGIGKYTFLNRARYEGEYVDGKRKGKGIMTYPDGTVYNGEWEENKRHGQGIYTYRNGDYYDGEWKEGRKHGKGRYVFVGQGIMYDGSWDYDRFEGDGSLVTNSYTFKGVFSEQEPIGDGVYTFNNNCVQHGEYIMKRHLKYIQGDVSEVFVPKWFCTALATTGVPREKNILLT